MELGAKNLKTKFEEKRKKRGGGALCDTHSIIENLLRH